MDNISDFLPVLLIVGSILFSVIGSEQKKKKQNKEKTELPKWAQSKSEEPQKRFYTPAPEEKKQARVYNLIEDAVHQQREEQREKGVSVLANKQFRTEPMELEEDTSSSIFSISEENELKRAIIYSEIFQRRDY